ncbi:MAG TPA: hypothetical protein VFN38_05000 [Gemmatimonadaceae bacterium]|nr:hypothetical protein [Gemmatimonadaceae bacterium]
MRRRVFLSGVGAAAAGMAVGLRARRARASEPSLVSFFQEARRAGKPMLVVT